MPPLGLRGVWSGRSEARKDKVVPGDLPVLISGLGGRSSFAHRGWCFEGIRELSRARVAKAETSPAKPGSGFASVPSAAEARWYRGRRGQWKKVVYAVTLLNAPARTPPSPCMLISSTKLLWK